MTLEVLDGSREHDLMMNYYNLYNGYRSLAAGGLSIFLGGGMLENIANTYRFGHPADRSQLTEALYRTSTPDPPPHISFGDNFDTYMFSGVSAAFLFSLSLLFFEKGINRLKRQSRAKERQHSFRLISQKG